MRNLADPTEARMSLGEHLAELRTRLLKCTLAVAALGIASLTLAKPIFGLLMQPVLAALPPESRSLIYTSGIEELNVLMKVGLYCGIFLATPVILWQLWGFVAPGLYQEERKHAAPFVLSGSLAFLAGGLFCYYTVLPSMFGFLLTEGDSRALELRLDTGRLHEDDALRLLRIGEVERAGQVALAASEALRAEGEGQTEPTAVTPSRRVELEARLAGLGRLVDATAAAVPGARGVVRQAVERRMEAVAAFGREDHNAAVRAMDEAASLLAGALPTRAEEMSVLWRLEKDLAAGHSRYEAQTWTRPMLTMREQLSLVLLLLLAFGVIFEMPVVMALLGFLGVIKASFLFRYQRHAFVVCLIAAALLTPTGDVVNLALMGGPMVLCYEVGLVAVWLIERNRARKSPAAADAPPA